MVPLPVVVELVATVKLAVVAPAATATLAGSVTAARLLDSDTTAPPGGAALVRLTVPDEELPAVTLVGVRASVLRLAAGGTGVTLSVVVLLVPP